MAAEKDFEDIVYDAFGSIVEGFVKREGLLTGVEREAVCNLRDELNKILTIDSANKDFKNYKYICESAREEA